jgi:hypothetical protein
MTAKLHIGVSFDLPLETRQRASLPIVAAFPVAALVAFVSLVGILFPTVYARETPNWAAQALGQDWVDLLFAVPWLSVTGLLALRGSRRALFLLGGGMLYIFYEFVIYGFAVHFNALFLAYCATLGVTFFALAGMAVRLLGEDVQLWYGEKPPIRTAGFFLIGVGVLFTMAWLGDVIPALVHGTTPESVSEAGVPTNPVHVIDLSIILPLHVIAGVALLQRRKLGYTLAPIVLSFGVIMALSIAGMLVVMRQRGIDASLAIATSMGFVAASSAAILGLVLRRLRSE